MSKTALNAILAAQAGTEKAKTERFNRLWDGFMSVYGTGGAGLKSLIDQSNGLQAAANDTFLNSIDNNTGTYTGALADLGNRLNSDASKVTFGLEGFDPITSTKRSAREDVGALAGLAGNAFIARNDAATKRFATDTDEAESVMDYYNAMSAAREGAQSGDLSGLAQTYLSANPNIARTKTQRIWDNINHGGVALQNLSKGIDGMLGTVSGGGGEGGSGGGKGGSIASIMSLLKMIPGIGL